MLLSSDRFHNLLALSCLLIACGGGAAVDEPCESDDSCEEGLVCDDHGGEKTCQVPHEHGPGTTTATSSTSTSTGTGGSADGGGGGMTDPCADYCACLEPTCGAYAAYPYDAAGSCLAACQAYTEMERTCFAAFCVQASEAVAGKEHLCEHAWGGEGTGEC
jgi:hypothetical protein